MPQSTYDKFRAQTAPLSGSQINPTGTSSYDSFRKKSAYEDFLAKSKKKTVEPTWGDSLITGALRTVPSVVGSIAGGMGAGIPSLGLGAVGGGIAGGAAGAGIGETLAQWYERTFGLREEMNPWQVGVQTGIGAVPFVGKAPGVGAGVKEIAKFAGKGAAQGAVLGGASTFPTEWAETGGLPTFGQVATNTGIGGVFGGVTAGAMGKMFPSMPELPKVDTTGINQTALPNRPAVNVVPPVEPPPLSPDMIGQSSPWPRVPPTSIPKVPDVIPPQITGRVPSVAPPPPTNTASVPFMITRQMTADLKARGFNDAQINAMSPADAQNVLQGKSIPLPGIPDVATPSYPLPPPVVEPVAPPVAKVKVPKVKVPKVTQPVATVPTQPVAPNAPAEPRRPTVMEQIAEANRLKRAGLNQPPAPPPVVEPVAPPVQIEVKAPPKVEVPEVEPVELTTQIEPIVPEKPVGVEGESFLDYLRRTTGEVWSNRRINALDDDERVELKYNYNKSQEGFAKPAETPPPADVEDVDTTVVPETTTELPPVTPVELPVAPVTTAPPAESPVVTKAKKTVKEAKEHKPKGTTLESLHAHLVDVVESGKADVKVLSTIIKKGKDIITEMTNATSPEDFKRQIKKAKDTYDDLTGSMRLATNPLEHKGLQLLAEDLKEKTNALISRSKGEAPAVVKVEPTSERVELEIPPVDTTVVQEKVKELPKVEPIKKEEPVVTKAKATVARAKEGQAPPMGAPDSDTRRAYIAWEHNQTVKKYEAKLARIKASNLPEERVDWSKEWGADTRVRTIKQAEAEIDYFKKRHEQALEAVANPPKKPVDIEKEPQDYDMPLPPVDPIKETVEEATEKAAKEIVAKGEPNWGAEAKTVRIEGDVKPKAPKVKKPKEELLPSAPPRPLRKDIRAAEAEEAARVTREAEKVNKRVAREREKAERARATADREAKKKIKETPILQDKVPDSLLDKLRESAPYRVLIEPLAVRGITQLQRLGETGGKIAKLLMDEKTESARYFGQYSGVIRNIRRELSESEQTEVVKILDGQKPLAEATNDKVKTAYTQLRSMLNELGDTAESAGVRMKDVDGKTIPFEKFMGEYFPHRFGEDFYKNLDNIRDVLLKERDKTGKLANSPAAVDAMMKRIVEKGERFSTSQHRRIKDMAGYKEDLNSLEAHVLDMTRTITRTKRLGPMDVSNPDSEISKLIAKTSNPKKAQGIVNEYLNRTELDADKKAQHEIYEKIVKWQVWSKLSQFSITNLGDLAGQASNLGVRNTTKAIFKTLANPHGSVDEAFETGSHAMLRKEIYNEVEKKNLLGAGTDYLSQRSEKFIRTVGAIAGKAEVQRLFAIAKKNPKYAKALARFVDGNVDDVLKQDVLTKQQIDFAGGRAVELTSGVPDRLTLSKAFLADNPILRLPLLFKRFAFMNTKNIAEAVKSAPTPLAKAKKAAAILAAFQIAGEGVGDIKAAIRGFVSGDIEKSLEERGEYVGSGNPVFDRIMANYMQAALFGILGDVTESMVRKRVGKFSGAVGGPVISDIDEAAGIFSDLTDSEKKDRTKSLQRGVARRVPYIGHGLADRLKDEEKGGFGSKLGGSLGGNKFSQSLGSKF